MSSGTRIADYFFVASVRIDKNDLEMENPNPVIVDRFPETDYEDTPFTENAEFFCLPEGARIEYREVEKRKPYVFTFCFTQSLDYVIFLRNRDGSQSYGTSLVFYEKLKIDGIDCYNKFNQELYIPKALCILSLKPFFSCHISFLRGLYKKAIQSEDADEDTLDAINSQQVRPLSDLRTSSIRRFSSQHSSNSSLLDATSPIEFDIRYYIQFIPFYQPGYEIQVQSIDLIYHQIPLFNDRLTLRCPPQNSLPFCDSLCMRSLLSCLSLSHIQEIVSCLLRDGQVLLHSQNKYQLTLCSTALLSLLLPIQYTLTFIPLLPSQLIDYIEAPTPYLIGIFSTTFAKHSFDDAVQSMLVHLDFDKLTYPPNYVSYPLPISHMDLFDLAAPLRYSILWSDRPESKMATSCLFTVQAGPGPLGLLIRQERRQLVYVPPGTPAVLEEVAYIDSEKSKELKGWIGSYINKCTLLQGNPAILEINDIPVVGFSLRRITVMLASAPRPITILLQVGLRDIPIDVQNPTDGPLLDVRVPNQTLEFEAYYYEVRIAFFSFFIEFFSNFNPLFEKSGVSQNFDKKSFVQSFPESMQSFIEEFCSTQLFEGLLLTLEREAQGEKAKSDADRETWKLMKLVKEGMQLLKEKELREGMLAVRQHLIPKNWNLKTVKLPEINEEVDEDTMLKIDNRSTIEFPRLLKELLNESVTRFEFSCTSLL